MNNVLAAAATELQTLMHPSIMEVCVYKTEAEKVAHHLPTDPPPAHTSEIKIKLTHPGKQMSTLTNEQHVGLHQFSVLEVPAYQQVASNQAHNATTLMCITCRL